MVKGLHTVWCQASDMDKSVAFYRDILGLKPEIVSPYWSQFDLGSGKLGLHPPLAGQEAPLGLYGKGWFVGFETEDLRGLRTKLEAAGAKIEGDCHDIPGGAVLDFCDPDGNTLEAFQPGIKAADLAG